MAHTPPPGRSDATAFAAAAGELIDEVQNTIQDEEPTARAERRSPWLVPGVLGVVFVCVAAWNVWLLQAASPRLSATEARRADGVMVFVATQAVEGYAAVHGRMPERLEDAGVVAPGLMYRAQADGFAISAVRDGAAVHFAREDNVDDFMIRMGIAPPDSTTPEIVP